MVSTLPGSLALCGGELHSKNPEEGPLLGKIAGLVLTSFFDPIIIHR